MLVSGVGGATAAAAMGGFWVGVSTVVLYPTTPAATSWLYRFILSASDMRRCVPVRTRVRPSYPDSRPRGIHELVDDLSSTKHGPTHPSHAACIMSHLCPHDAALVVEWEAWMESHTTKSFDYFGRNTLLEIHLAVDVTCIARLPALCLRASGRNAETWGVKGGLRGETA